MTKKNTFSQRSKTLEQRFQEKVRKSESCWIWTSAVCSKGYGVFWCDSSRRSQSAHRIALELYFGYALPDDKLVMHSCDNPSCVNPSHLSLGTSLDNMIDAKTKGRLAAGERNGGGGKLKVKDVKKIKKTVGKVSGAEWGRRLGVSRYLVNAIRRGEIWKCVD